MYLYGYGPANLYIAKCSMICNTINIRTNINPVNKDVRVPAEFVFMCMLHAFLGVCTCTLEHKMNESLVTKVSKVVL